MEITKEEIEEKLNPQEIQKIKEIIWNWAVRKAREKKRREGSRRERLGEFFCKKKMAVKY